MSLAGKVLQNRYLVQKQIGMGGMGTVYVATDQRFGSTVAIKETLFTDPNLRRAFEREAQLLNSLRHPALPRVSDHFSEGNGAFIVMEYIPGADLSEMVERDGEFAVADVLRWADDLLDALDYLHNQKFPVIHRDIKPQNLKLTSRGEIILLDFGLAKGSATELSQVSMTKSVFGYSRSYAPLEQIQGTGTDPRSDLYSLAATLYHLITGKTPIDALTRATEVLNGAADPLPSARALNSKIPVSVSNVFHQAMALNANLRPATAAQMRFAISEALSNQETVEFYDGTTILSGAVSQADVFTQNTQLMNAQATQGINNAERVEETGGATNVSSSQNLTTPSSAQMTKPAETQTNNVDGLTPRRNRSILKPAGIAAAVLLLGGAIFAFFNNNLINSNNRTNPTEQLSLSPELKPDSESEAQSPASQSETNPNNPNAAAPTTDAAPAVQNKTTASSSGAQTKPNDLAKTETGKNKSGRTASKSSGLSANDETDFVNLPNVDKEIDEAMKDAKDKGNGFDSIPPEIRSNDPRNPVDREKLKIFIKKKREQVMRQVEEANRLRARQGLPPLTPKPPKNKIDSPPKNADDDNN